MTSDQESDNNYSFLVNIALAPHIKPGVKPHDQAVLNSSIRFQAVIIKGVYGTVAHAARRFVEEAPSNIFLAPMINREIDESTVGTTAVEFIYGDGYRTLIVRKEGPEPKSYRQVGILLSIGDDDVEDPSTLPLLMPDDDFWHHVMNTYDPYSGKGIPTVYIRTSELLFLNPKNSDHESSIAVTVSTKRGLWKSLSFDGKREKYPDVLPKAVSRKRKQENDDAPEGVKEKKKPKTESKARDDASDDDEPDDDESEEKPKKKAPQKETPSKKKPSKEETDDEDDDSDEEEKPTKKPLPKKKASKKVKANDDGESAIDQVEEVKKAKRKSNSSSKPKASKDKKKDT